MLMLLALLSCAGKAGAQTVAVKSDLLTGGMLASPNLGVELKLSERFTLEAGVHYNPFPAGGDKRWKHWFVQPELRYWMCRQRPVAVKQVVFPCAIFIIQHL